MYAEHQSIAPINVPFQIHACHHFCIVQLNVHRVANWDLKYENAIAGHKCQVAFNLIHA